LLACLPHDNCHAGSQIATRYSLPHTSPALLQCSNLPQVIQFWCWTWVEARLTSHCTSWSLARTAATPTTSGVRGAIRADGRVESSMRTPVLHDHSTQVLTHSSGPTPANFAVTSLVGRALRNQKQLLMPGWQPLTALCLSNRPREIACRRAELAGSTFWTTVSGPGWGPRSAMLACSRPGGRRGRPTTCG
jgi:hypothetical protein